MEKKLISIQIMPEGKSLRWDDCRPTFHELSEVGETTQAIATATGRPVRMTYLLGTPDEWLANYRNEPALGVGRLNGHYFYPPATIHRFPFAGATQKFTPDELTDTAVLDLYGDDLDRIEYLEICELTQYALAKLKTGNYFAYSSDHAIEGTREKVIEFLQQSF